MKALKWTKNAVLVRFVYLEISFLLENKTFEN
jgi:hypothetical protein